MKKIFSIGLLFTCLIAVGQNTLNLVPMPAEVKMGKGFCTIQEPIGFLANDGFESGDGGVGDFKEYLKKNFKLTKFVDGSEHSYGLPTEFFIDIDNNRKNDGYEIEIKKKEIIVRGNPTGIFYAFETLKQILSNQKAKIKNQKLSIPQLSITDAPRFQYRGMHLDVARHFYPISFVKKYIDYLAAYKFNTFHWHLTDDQGWRIEIKKYPKLTQVGGYRNGTIIGRYPGKGNDGLHYGGFYTQAQIKEIVQYAADRYITVIPEIEMPGHASAAIAAYPQLSCFPNEDTQVPKGCTWSGTTTGKQVQQTWGVFEDVFAPTDYTFNFLQDVLDEVITLFPSKYIHIGGDECPKEAWKRSDFCQQLIKEKNVKDEHGLQSYFINRIEKYLNSKGKNIIGWDEILEGGLAPNATVMSWRGEAGGIEAAKQNHDVIMTPGKPVYFDHSQSKNEDSVTIGGYNSLEDVYAYEPIPKELSAEQAKHVLGAQANMWTEYMKNERKVEYMLFPRIAALSEVLWTPKEKRNWNDFERRLPTIFERLEKQKINYSKAYYDLKATVLQTEDREGLIWQLKQSKENVMAIITSENKHSYIAIPIYGENGKKIKDTIIQNEDLYAKYTLDKVLNIKIIDSKDLVAYLSKQLTKPKDIKNILNDKIVTKITQKFSFNKATGKKITLTTQASKNYPGDGAFTLVNGVQNEKGLAKSSEFLGFLGTDMEAIIDFGKTIEFKTVTINSLTQIGSWIYPPKSCNFFISDDGVNFVQAENPFSDVEPWQGRKTRLHNLQDNNYKARYIKVIANNYGKIPDGNPGAGNPAWLFVDEIEVE